ncbi:MAG TPA: LysR family transcriptional regulator [Xanthomonadaceae bacterium]|nr:LysR family transcriptional regulator [Xanthomonadaceae bacterium]
MDRLDDIALFLRVLDTGSISAAARSLGLSDAVASQHLKRLEAVLGLRLVHRTTRRLHVTPEGLALAERARPLVEEFEALAAGLRQSGSDVAGNLRVTMGATFGRMYVSPLLPAFMARHPLVRVVAHLSDQTVDLVGDGFDLAIRIGELSDSSLVSRRIAANRRVLCAAPVYLQRHGTPEVPGELAQHNCLLLFDSHRRRDSWELHGPDGATAEVRVAGRLESTLGELLRDAAVAGEGIAMFSHWHVAEDLRTGRLQRVLPDWSIRETGIYAVMPQRRFVPPRVRAFVEFLEAHFSQRPPWEAERRDT